MYTNATDAINPSLPYLIKGFIYSFFIWGNPKNSNDISPKILTTTTNNCTLPTFLTPKIFRIIIKNKKITDKYFIGIVVFVNTNK